MLVEALPEYNIKKEALRLNDGRWLLPDIIINDKFIVEFYGTLWHADPTAYEADAVVHHGISAGEIWKSDEERIRKIENAGYSVIIVWQREFKSNEQQTVERIKEIINEQNKNQ